MAYATSDAGEVWTAFPVLNALDEPFLYYYEWDASETPLGLLELPVASQEPAVALTFNSTPPTQDTVSHGNVVTYVVTLENQERENIADGTISWSDVLTPTTGNSLRTNGT